ncbi:DUF4351 domain-containing protein [Thiorhodococcus mannitoliphagus]|uniref:DUF4351 domain-containing protein n=2 Tax=Thiorhodococcus mannitoliphagus TaxID=329406 RepID=A0A6P1E2X8_9GAMM|nr:DUF4351 domain-containing protein [Thiorhodococcus mannitoliphagus]
MSERPDYDSPWKEAIGAYFEPFMRLFFEPVHARIDWHHHHEFLDAELLKITGDSQLGKRFADRLVRVRSRQGQELWLLIHIEIQGQADTSFNHRMFQYYYRIHDHHPEAEIVSLAVLTNQPDCSRLGRYASEHDGYGVQFCFRVHNLQDWAIQWEPLKAQAASNPFAVVALAQLAAHRKASDPERKASKREIIWLLYHYHYAREDALALLRFIDWMLRLPRALELELRNELITLEESTKMPYVMSFEQMALERGEKRGEKRGEERGEKRGETKALLRMIQARFGPPTPEQLQQIESADIPQLDTWLDRLLTASTLEELLDG